MFCCFLLSEHDRNAVERYNTDFTSVPGLQAASKSRRINCNLVCGMV
jgi:hypothetical protein